MLYSEKVKLFAREHPCEEITVDGARTLAFLNGGMNTLEMWLDYVDELSQDYRVLLFDYPQALRTNQALVTGMHAFFAALSIERPIFIGASDGGRFCGARGENSSDSSQSGLLLRKNAEGPDCAHVRPEDRLRLRRAPVHCA